MQTTDEQKREKKKHSINQVNCTCNKTQIEGKSSKKRKYTLRTRT